MPRMILTNATISSILITPSLFKSAVELDGADINNDGEVNILDIVALVNIILSN